MTNPEVPMLSVHPLTVDDSARWDEINKRVLDIIYSPKTPTPIESDLVWLARRFVAAHKAPTEGTSEPTQ